MLFVKFCLVNNLSGNLNCIFDKEEEKEVKTEEVREERSKKEKEVRKSSRDSDLRIKKNQINFTNMSQKSKASNDKATRDARKRKLIMNYFETFVPFVQMIHPTQLLVFRNKANHLTQLFASKAPREHRDSNPQRKNRKMTKTHTMQTIKKERTSTLPAPYFYRQQYDPTLVENNRVHPELYLPQQPQRVQSKAFLNLGQEHSNLNYDIASIMAGPSSAMRAAANVPETVVTSSASIISIAESNLTRRAN